MLSDQKTACSTDTPHSPLPTADLQLKPYRTDDFHKLFYETSRFSAFNCQWVIKARINDNQRDPSQSCDRCMTYQVRSGT